MKRLSNLGNVFGLHPGIRRIDLAGFAGSQVNHRMRKDGNDEHQQETLENVAKNKGLHPRLILQPEFTALKTQASIRACAIDESET